MTLLDLPGEFSPLPKARGENQHNPFNRPGGEADVTIFRFEGYQSVENDRHE
jgi:hypothetical protein